MFQNFIAELMQQELNRFAAENPTSLLAHESCQSHFLFGFPMHWMQDWPFPGGLHIKEASGAVLKDIDGHTLVDFCLGDTGAMFGHSPAGWLTHVQEAMGKGVTAMLPSDALATLGSMLQQRFGFDQWQLALSASDANRFLLRWARAATGRPIVLVFDGCYHGAVDDTLVDLGPDGKTIARASVLGGVHNHHEFTRVIPFNDLTALELALATHDVACLLAEPALTNCGMVLPDEGFWAAAQHLCQQHQTLLIMDETHTISTGLGGYCQSMGFKPDALVLGKAVAGGLPCAVYGVHHQLAQQMMRAKSIAAPGHSGIGTTLAGGLLSVQALLASLTHLHTQKNYNAMLEKANRLADGLRQLIRHYQRPWIVSQLGARLELQFRSSPARNAQDIRDTDNEALQSYLHLYMLNRGVVLTPFHNMMLCSPSTSNEAVLLLLEVFESWLLSLESPA